MKAIKKMIFLSPLLLAAVQVNAAIVSYNFSGEITTGAPDMPVGTPTSINISWDTDTPVGSAGAATSYDNAILSLTGTVGGDAFTGAEDIHSSIIFHGFNGFISIGSETDSDIFTAWSEFELSGINVDLGGRLVKRVVIDLIDDDANAFTSHDLSTSLTMGDFLGPLDTARMNIVYNGITVESSITSLIDLNVIPIPAAVWLFFSGIGSLTLFAARNKNKQIN